MALGGQTAAVAELGAVLMHLLQMLTELVFSAFLDHYGVMGTPVKRITTLRATGLAIAVAGSAVTLVTEGSQSTTKGSAFLGWVSISVLAGLARAFQTVVNGSLSRTLGSKAEAATWSLGSASVILAVAVPIELSKRGGEGGGMGGFSLSETEWWMYTGGFFSCGSVFGAVLLAPLISLAGLHMSVALGQCSTTLVVDYYGWFGFTQRDPTLQRVSGVTCIFIGSVLVSRDQGQQSSAAHDSGAPQPLDQEVEKPLHESSSSHPYAAAETVDIELGSGGAGGATIHAGGTPAATGAAPPRTA